MCRRWPQEWDCSKGWPLLSSRQRLTSLWSSCLTSKVMNGTASNSCFDASNPKFNFGCHLSFFGLWPYNPYYTSSQLFPNLVSTLSLLPWLVFSFLQHSQVYCVPFPCTEKLSEYLKALRHPPICAVVMLVFRVILVRFSPSHLMAFWPAITSELVRINWMRAALCDYPILQRELVKWLHLNFLY